MLRASEVSETVLPVPAELSTDEVRQKKSESGTPFLFRLASLDAYRGFVMLLMMAEVLRLQRVSEALPESGLWRFLAHHQSHVEWIGCSLHDLIQPSFSFLVGVALPFSIASRMAKGQPQAQLVRHAFTRALILILIGIFLRSLGRPQTYFTFEDTLTQIGLGYGFLFLLGQRSGLWHWAALGVILAGYWLAFALWPLPAPGFDLTAAGVPQNWPHLLTGFAAHWNKNTNLAWAFDQWFLNLFPRERQFVFNGGGYATLSFIPTLGTMILGLIAGKVLRDKRAPLEKVKWFVLAGVIGLVSGSLIGWLGLCPVVKRIWTPSWVLFSGGWCFLLLAAFYLVIDVRGWKRWAFPLVVIGMNSIAAYCMDHLFTGFIAEALPRHLGAGVFNLAGAAYQPLLLGAAVLLTHWIILYWMYRRKIFLRI
jgi:predicted acyltransferase